MRVHFMQNQELQNRAKDVILHIVLEDFLRESRRDLFKSFEGGHR
jgi:hypothetical protein